MTNIDGIKTSKPYFNVPSILKTNKSKKKRCSVRFKENTFFPKRTKEITEKSFDFSANTSNLVPSIERHKLKPSGVYGNHINTMENQEKYGPKSLQLKINNNMRFFGNGFPKNDKIKSKRVETLKKDLKFKRSNTEKSRTQNSMKIVEEKSNYTEKTKKKQRSSNDKNILKTVGKRVLKRVKECIRGIDNLNVNIISDQKSKKITFSINDTNDQAFGLQFDFVMGNESQEVNLNDFMISSNETSPLTPSKANKIEEETIKQPPTKTKNKNNFSKEKELKKFSKSFIEKPSKSLKNNNHNNVSDIIEKYPHVMLQESKKELSQFEEYMKEKLNGKDWGMFSKSVLQLLYGIGIKSSEFSKMGLSWQKMFKKLLVDRYFKDVKENIYERLARNPNLRDLLISQSKRDNLDIWGISVEDYKIFYGNFENYFKSPSNSNYPELNHFFLSPVSYTHLTLPTILLV